MCAHNIAADSVRTSSTRHRSALCGSRMSGLGPFAVRNAADMPADLCSMCARELDLHDRHVRFTLPQPVLDTPEKETAPGTWLSHATARESVMMQVPSLGAFVRALVPVRLLGGHTLTYGVWLAIHPGNLQRIFGLWWKPEYADLEVTGWLANPVPPWGMLAAPVVAVVRDTEHTPYCDRSDDPTLSRVLHDQWPHDVVLDAAGPA